MNGKSVGRLIRSNPVTARALTEYRVRQLRLLPQFEDLRLCMSAAVSGTTAIDVGASVGNYSLGLSKAVGRRGRVLALEANPAVYRELVRSTWRTGVESLNLAASSRSGTAELFVPVDEDGTQHEPIASLEARPAQSGKTVQVPCSPLDALVDGLTPVSVVKIDVEGHEADVIEGANTIIEEYRPVFLIEIEERHLVGKTVADVVGLLTSRGYSAWGIHGRQLIPWEDYDVDQWQTSYLSAPAGRDPADYVNNFLFRP